MSEALRKKFKIPDTYTRDGKLTNWFRKHLGMVNLEGVYARDTTFRDTLTKKGTNIYYPSMLLVFPDKCIQIILPDEGIDICDISKIN